MLKVNEMRGETMCISRKEYKIKWRNVLLGPCSIYIRCRALWNAVELSTVDCSAEKVCAGAHESYELSMS